ncbi:MAG: TRM11 family SAM-dependent methyltransferase [Christensenellales bacterium]
MKCALLIYPHANVRYRESMKKLAAAELCMTGAAGIVFAKIGGLELLCFEGDEVICQKVQRLSCAQAVFKLQGNTLVPMMEGYEPYLSGDMPGILKYKGKTNDSFTRLLINASLMASNSEGENKNILDPMCGRGTSMFSALSAGHNGYGIDIDKKDFEQFKTFTLQYLKFHRMKHNVKTGSYTGNGRQAGVFFRVSTAAEPDAYASGDTRTIEMVKGDTRDAALIYKKGRFDAIVADLPYGVQHRAEAERLNIGSLLEKAAPVWLSLLKPGCAMAIAFNSYTLKREAAEQALTKAGAEIMGGCYADMEHWVEQAVMRDVVVAKRCD